MSKPFRSLLSVPAVRTEFYVKAAACDVDIVMVDLEDSVFPERKDEARTLLTQALQEVDWRGKPVLARVNAIGTEWGFSDLIRLGLDAPDLSGFMVPKVETVDEFRYLEQVLNGLDGMRPSGRPLELHLLIETALGVANVERILQAATRLQSVTIGLGDYAMSLGLAGGLGEGAQAAGSVSPLVDTWRRRATPTAFVRLMRPMVNSPTRRACRPPSSEARRLDSPASGRCTRPISTRSIRRIPPPRHSCCGRNASKQRSTRRVRPVKARQGWTVP